MADKCWLDTVHPAYSATAPHWIFARQSYEGGPGYFAANLIKNSLEYPEDYAERLSKACRYNFTAQSVGIVTGHLLKEGPTRKAEAVSESVRAFWAKATKDGDDIDTLSKELANWSSVYGRLYVVIDVPSADGDEPATEYERKARGIEPYAYQVAPDDVLDLAFDGDGELLWIKILERYRDDADPRTAADDVSIRYRLWEPGKWSLWEKSKDAHGKQIEVCIGEGVVPFAKIPVAIVEHKDGGQYTSPGLVDDLVYIDRSIFNLMSELDETIGAQAFGQLCIPSDAVSDEATNASVVAMGKKKIFTYNAAASHAPFYLSPDASQAGTILQTIDQRCKQAHDSVNLGDEVGGSKSQGSSGVSGITKAYSFAKLEAGLSDKAGELEEAELEIANIVDLWTGGKGEITKDAITYAKKFDVIALQQALTDALSLDALLGGSSPTAIAELRKAAVSKALDQSGPKTLQKINDEIDAFALVEATEPNESGEVDPEPNPAMEMPMGVKVASNDQAGAVGKAAAGVHSTATA